MLLSHGIPWAFRVLIEKEPGRGRRYVHAGRGITISGEWQEDLQHGYGVPLAAMGRHLFFLKNKQLLVTRALLRTEQEHYERSSWHYYYRTRSYERNKDGVFSSKEHPNPSVLRHLFLVAMHLLLLAYCYY